MDRFKKLEKPFIALFLIVVFAWVIVVTRYKYEASDNTSNSTTSLTVKKRIDRLTGETEYRLLFFEDNNLSSDSGWKTIEKALAVHRKELKESQP